MSTQSEIQNTKPLSPTAADIINNTNTKTTNNPQTKPFNSKTHYVSKWEMKNANFEEYYKRQKIITDPTEWTLFLKTLHTELPTSFRFNPASKLHKLYKQRIIDDYYNLKKAEEDKVTHEGITFRTPKPIPFYPHQMAWQCNFPKRYLNKHKQYFAPFREFLIECNDNGIISRQETVSMIPGLFLSKFITPNDIIMDVCAAPGNKTAQILELMHYDLNGTRRTCNLNDRGFIFANDADERRAHVMVHQLKRVGINDFVITNKLAQCIPRLKGVRCGIDNILCDVPCSSDGTLRKAPDLWKKWSTAFGNGLHSVQLSILIHALHLLKPGGHCVYSTCSFNPIENEAVIASALLKLNKYYSNGNDTIQFELVDCSGELVGLKRNKGLETWVVWDKLMREDCWYERYSDAKTNRRKFIKETQFPPMVREQCQGIRDKVLEYLQLQRCMRFLPHLHDSSGFFVAVIHKRVTQKREETKESSTSECGMLDNAKLFEIEKREFDRRNVWNDNVPYYRMEKLANSESELQKLIAFYGMKVKSDSDSDSKENEAYFDCDELLVRGLVNPRSLWFVPKSIANVIGNTDNHQLRIVQSGCRAFVRHDTKVTQHACKWRLTQDGCLYLAKYVTKQIIHLPLPLFIMFCFVGKLEFEFVEGLENGKYKALVEDIMRAQSGGPIIVALNESECSAMMNDMYMALSAWKCFARIDLMVKKQTILLLQRHLMDVYRPECVELNERKYENLVIDFECNTRSKFNELKNKQKSESKRKKFSKKKKKKGSKNRDWTHRKKKDGNNDSNSKNSNNSGQ